MVWQLITDIIAQLGVREIGGPLVDVGERLHRLVSRFDVGNVCIGTRPRG